MEIRQVTVEERTATTFALGAYAFNASPWAEEEVEAGRGYRPYQRETVFLVAEEGGEALACVAAYPMRQNLRGVVHPMAGIAGVASHPAARRRGLVRMLLQRLLRQMRDEGHPVSALYPFRPSFYGRFGFVGLPRVRTAAFAPAGLGHLVRAELPGTVTRLHIRQGYAEQRALTLRLLEERHGFAVFAESRAEMLRDKGEQWVALAQVDGEVVGAVTYRIEAFGGDLVADELLSTGPLGRALLLQYFARHVDQVARIVLKVGAEEVPELWATDLAVDTRAEVAFPTSPAPMARVLSVHGLTGLPVGTDGPAAGGVSVEVVDDELIGGRYRLTGEAGRLVVDRVPGEVVADATVTSAGLAGLVYGVLDPVEVVTRGFGTVGASAVDGLRALFPRSLPYLYADF